MTGKKAGSKGKTIVQRHKANLETLKRVFASGHATLVECQRVSDGEIVAMLAAVIWDGQNHNITPFAEMVNGNPYELYRPPNPDGGFAPTESEERS